MIIPLLRDLFDIECVSDASDFELRYRIRHVSHQIFFSLPRTEIDALAILKSNEINFHKIANELLKNIPEAVAAKKGRIKCTWLVCSERGGIYLFEAIATKENIKYGRLKNTFIILNSCDGTVSFGPGHIKNGLYTERMRELIDSYRSITPEKWHADFTKTISEILVG
jgi:hypothetical protein